MIERLNRAHAILMSSPYFDQRADALNEIDGALADSLDAAWAEAEAALPEGGRIYGARRLYDGGWEFSAEWWTYDARYRAGRATGDTPAAALRALAAKLRERGA